jgi:hypothetical protein
MSYYWSRDWAWQAGWWHDGAQWRDGWWQPAWGLNHGRGSRALRTLLRHFFNESGSDLPYQDWVSSLAKEDTQMMEQWQARQEDWNWAEAEDGWDWRNNEETNLQDDGSAAEPATSSAASSGSGARASPDAAPLAPWQREPARVPVQPAHPPPAHLLGRMDRQIVGLSPISETDESEDGLISVAEESVVEGWIAAATAVGTASPEYEAFDEPLVPYDEEGNVIMEPAEVADGAMAPMQDSNGNQDNDEDIIALQQMIEEANDAIED